MQLELDPLAADAAAQAGQALADLPPGEHLTLVTATDPRSFLAELRGAAPCPFTWHVLQARPDRFRYLLIRLAESGPRSVNDHLGADHDRLDSLMGEVRALIAAGRVAEAGERFAEFRAGLEQHIEAEEGVLFPAFERLTGIRDGGPTTVMRAEHVLIKDLLGGAHRLLGEGDGPAAEEAIALLVETLGEHNLKEERILYPMTDQVAGPAGRDELVRLIEAV